MQRRSVIERVTERFERRLAQECGQLRVEMVQGFGSLRAEMIERNAELLKWGGSTPLPRPA